MRISTASAILLATITSASIAQQRDVTHATPLVAVDQAKSHTRLSSAGPKLDTLMDFMMRSKGLLQYQYPPDPMKPEEMLPVTGTNPSYHALGVRFDFTGRGAVRGLLIGVRDKAIAGRPDTLMALVMECDEKLEMSEEGLLAQASIPTDRLDTGSVRIRMTPLAFPASAPLTTGFLALLQTRQFMPGAGEDRIGLWSNVHKDGRGENRAIVMSYDMEEGAMYVLPLSQIFNLQGEPLDIDPAIVPILEVEVGTSGADLPTLGAIRMSGAYPNPAMNHVAVGFTAQSAGDVEIALLDARGSMISTTTTEVAAGETRSIAIDLTSVPNGTYYYVLTLGTSSVAGTVTVVK